MINSLKYILSIIMIFFMLFSCSADITNKNDNNSKLQIAVSIYPLFDIVRNITGDKADVYFIIPPGANPHIFEPAPRDIERLLKADIFFGISEDFDLWIVKMTLSDTPIYYLSETDNNLYQDNPHIWLSVRGAIKLSEKIFNILSVIDPENLEYYLENYSKYKEELRKLDEEFEEIFTSIENRRFIQWHPAWDYFAEDYDLEIIGTIKSGHADEPSIKEIQQLIERAEENDVKVVVIGLDEHSPTAEVFSSEIEGILLKLDAIGNPQIEERSTYIKMMRFNAENLSGFLKRY